MWWGVRVRMVGRADFAAWPSGAICSRRPSHRASIAHVRQSGDTIAPPLFFSSCRSVAWTAATPAYLDPSSGVAGDGGDGVGPIRVQVDPRYRRHPDLNP